MRQHTTMTTGRASLCALGEYLRRHCFFAPVREQVQIPQKTVRYRPIDKLLDALGGILCGAKTISQKNVTIRTDRAVPRALGRTGCAEQSTIARPLRACTAENVAQCAQVSWYYLKRYGATPRPRFQDTRWWGDIALPPMPLGAKAEGSERTSMGRNRSKTGRKTLRITASSYRESLHETLLRGTETAVPALKAALLEGATPLGWSRERRAQRGLRLDGGFGTTEVLNWLLSRGYQGVAKISTHGRGPKLRPALGPWQPTSSPGREMAAVLRPHRFCRTTRHWGIRTPKAQGGYQYAVVLTTFPDLAPATVADAYDGRAMIEASFCQDKQARGLVKRRQHQWEAQQMGLLVARLAHHLLLWSKGWLSRVPTTRGRLEGYGLVRLLQEGTTVPGGIRWRQGWMVSIPFDPLPPLAEALQQGCAALFRERVRVGILR
jgi:hypothetical protein